MSDTPAPPASLVLLAKGLASEAELGLAPATVETAHDVFIATLTALANRLRMSEEVEKSATKRVAVRGVLLDPTLHVPGLKFSAEFREKAVYRIRVQTLNEDVDRTGVPASAGGEGLMEGAGAGAESTPAPSRKRARKEIAKDEPQTLEQALQRAVDIAFMSGNADIVAKLEPLLKAL